MNNHVNGNGSVVRYARWVIRWRFLIVPLTLILALAAGSGVRFLGFDTNYRVFFSEDNPQLQAFDALENIYNKNDNIMFALEPEDGDVFTPEMIALVAELTDESWKIPYARRVDSITNFQHSRGEEDDLIVEDLIVDPASVTRAELERARKIALAEPLILNRLISEASRVTGINVTLELSGEDPREVTSAVTHARAVADRIRAEHPDVRVYMSGTVMLNNAFSEGGENDMKTLVPLMFGVMILIMIVLLRSLSATGATVAVVMLSTVTALGITGWLGIKITPPSSIAPTMIMTLAIADSIHILISMLAAMRRGMNKDDAIVESLRINMLPVFLTSLTTAIGFLSLNFSDAPPFRDLGNITAIGVAGAFIYSVIFLPAFLGVLPVRATRRGTGNWGMDRIAALAVNRHRPLFWGSIVVVIGLLAFIPRNDLNDQFVNYFDERVAFRTDTDFIMDNLTGLYQLEYSLEAGESGGISEPAYLAKLDEFETWFREQPGVLQVMSLGHTIKKLNMNMHGDDPAEFRVPDNRELTAQYLLLYEMSLPYGLDINNQINVDKSSTRFSVILANMTSREMREMAKKGEDWLRDNAPESMFSYGIGPAIMFAYISERNINSMIRGTVVALILISFTLIFALRSLKYGVLSLIPNMIPGAMAFGMWGLLVGEVGIGLSTVITMSLGIVVDDTVHFLSKYIRARRENGLASREAIRYAFDTVGKALVFTSLILVTGFLVMTRSTFALNSVMGWFTAIVITFALAADFLFLPAILLMVDRDDHSVTVGDEKPAGAMIS